MNKFITKSGSCVLFAFALALIGTATVSAQQLPQPECGAPCFIDQSTGQIFCPCTDVHTPTVPEPMTLALLGSGLLGSAALTRKKNKKV